MSRGNRPLAAAVLVLLLGAGSARAADPPPIRLTFEVYAAGFNVLDIDSRVALRADGYRVDISYRTTGLFGVMFPSRIQSFTQGLWAGRLAEPVRFASWGLSRGSVRRVTLDYAAGQPVVTDLVPPTEPDRDPVPPAMQRDTIDSLTAMVRLVRQIAAGGNCDGRVRIFDGRRVLDIVSTTGGEETLAPDYRSSFAGPALRCDFAGRQLAGFQHDASEAELRRIHHSQAWLARVLPGGPPMPVRVVFETRYFGHATAFLRDAGRAGPPAPPG
jgi:hypothetical protein